MKKLIDILLIIVFFFVIYFLQANFFVWFDLAQVMPNLFIIFVMIIGLFMKQKYGFFLGMFFGFLLDIFIGDRIGINAITFSIIGMASVYLDKNFSKDNRMTFMIMTITMTIFAETLKILLKIIFCSSLFEWFAFIKILTIEVIYNAFIVIIFYSIFFFFGNKLEQDFMNSNNSFFKLL